MLYYVIMLRDLVHMQKQRYVKVTICKYGICLNYASTEIYLSYKHQFFCQPSRGLVLVIKYRIVDYGLLVLGHQISDCWLLIILNSQLLFAVWLATWVKGYHQLSVIVNNQLLFIVWLATWVKNCYQLSIIGYQLLILNNAQLLLAVW